MLDVNESTPTSEEVNKEASYPDPARKYVVDNDQDRPSTSDSSTSWGMKWLLNPLMLFIACIVSIAALTAAIIAFLLLMHRFFTAIAAPDTLANHGPWVTLGLGLVPSLLSISVVSFRLTQQCWVKIHGEKDPALLGA